MCENDENTRSLCTKNSKNDLTHMPCGLPRRHKHGRHGCFSMPCRHMALDTETAEILVKLLFSINIHLYEPHQPTHPFINFVHPLVQTHSSPSRSYVDPVCLNVCGCTAVALMVPNIINSITFVYGQSNTLIILCNSCICRQKFLSHQF